MRSKPCGSSPSFDLSAAVALFPELAVTTRTRISPSRRAPSASEQAIGRVARASAELTPVVFVGAPLRFEGKLFNAAVAHYRGRVLGITPRAKNLSPTTGNFTKSGSSPQPVMP